MAVVNADYLLELAQIITVTSKVNSNASSVFVDQLCFKQILLNLISKSVKFTKTGGKYPSALY